MSKSLLEKMEEAIRHPVPYEGLRVEPPEAKVTHGEPRPAPDPEEKGKPITDRVGLRQAPKPEIG